MLGFRRFAVAFLLSATVVSAGACLNSFEIPELVRYSSATGEAVSIQLTYNTLRESGLPYHGKKGNRRTECGGEEAFTPTIRTVTKQSSGQSKVFQANEYAWILDLAQD